jgi:ribonuclease HI
VVFSKTKKGTGAGVYCHGTKRKLSFSLVQYTTVFQAEVYAIKECAVENLDRDYKNRNIYIISNSQAAIESLGQHQITSKLVWDCHQSLMQLAKLNRVQLIWVPGHEGIAGNETADLLGKQDLNILNIRSQDLNQPVASQLGLARDRSGTGQTEITKNNGNPQLDSNRQRDSFHYPLPEEQRICSN